MLPMRIWAAVAGQGFSLGGQASADRWRAASALCEMMSRAALSHRRPSFGINEIKMRQPAGAGARGRGACDAVRHALALRQGRRGPAAAGSAGGAAQRSFRDPAARHRAGAAARARRLRHRLGQCARCRRVERPFRLRRICRALDHLPGGDGAGRARRGGVPALRPGAGGGGDHGRGRQSRPAAQHDPDGRARSTRGSTRPRSTISPPASRSRGSSRT